MSNSIYNFNNYRFVVIFINFNFQAFLCNMKERKEQKFHDFECGIFSKVIRSDTCFPSSEEMDLDFSEFNEWLEKNTSE